MTWGVISIVEISLAAIRGAKVVRFGHADSFSDNCGADEHHCIIQANRISVKPGETPAFLREKFVQDGDGGPWTKAGALAPIKLEKDDTEYEVL